MQRRKLQICLLITLLVAAGGSLLYQRNTGGPQQAPDITFSIIDGNQTRLKELRGRPVMVHFWATTCRECRKEIPRLRALYRDMHPQGLKFIAVAMPYDPPNRVLDLAKNAPLPYPVALDIDGAAVKAFGDVGLTPTTFLIAPDGQIVFQHTGKLNFKKLRNQIGELLATKQRAASHQPLVTGGSWLVAGGL